MTSPESIRETVESIVIAFILAFLFRTFEAEAFVIPTGSMAPTLLGRHKDVECPKCGYFFTLSASQEVDSATNRLTGNDTEGGTCPMCRFPMKLADSAGWSTKSYSGDRILVEKFPYQFRDPERFEVSVFKYPGGAKTNYIKRICGLPNETIRIQHGDLHVKRKGEKEFTIARKKDPKKLLAVLQPVYDTKYVASDLVAAGWPQRWTNGDETIPGASHAWTTEDHKSFHIDGEGSGTQWLRYQHVTPSHGDWQFLAQGLSPGQEPMRRLVSDFTAYNTSQLRSDLESTNPYIRRNAEYQLSGRGIHWVGDLALECDVDVESDGGEMLLELVEGGYRFQCSIDLSSGVATLAIVGRSDFGSPKAETKLRGTGRHDVRFANVDDQLRFWIDGSEVAFDEPTTYPPLDNVVPTEADLLPAGIASRGAAIQVHRLRLMRDLYYIAAVPNTDPLTDFEIGRPPFQGRDTTAEIIDIVMSDPLLWDYYADSRAIEFPLGDGEFLALGDNSGESRDSRLWGSPGVVGPEVPRDLLIGKALFVYWPHPENRIPGTNIPFPFFPNFRRMWVIR